MFIKVNIHLLKNRVIKHKDTSGVRCHLYTWSRWNPPIKNKMGMRTLFSRRGLHPRLQAIKLLDSLTQSTPNFVSSHPTSTPPSHHQRLMCIDLLGVGRLRCCLHLMLQQLLLKVGDHLRPLLNLGILRLHVVLKVDDSVGVDIHLLTGDVEQHMCVVPSMLGVTRVTVNLL
jgi:hypothetical protein